MERGAMPGTEPIHGTVTVRAPIDRAFDVFTRRMAAWWPLDTHSISVDQELPQRAVDLRVDGREGGRIEEVLDDDSTRDWGEIVTWQPPRRVGYAWKPNDRPTPPTEVDVRFTEDGDATRVELVHRGWERLGPAAEDIHPLYASDGGWTMVLERYREVTESEPAS
jgi:uncharacterized protein YndB with AHSA1/START domain